MVSHRRYFLVLTTVYAVFWAAFAIDPHDRGDWALENVLVVVAAVLLFFSYKRVLQNIGPGTLNACSKISNIGPGTLNGTF